MKPHTGISHLTSQRQINEESIKKRKKFDEDLKNKKRELREEFQNLEETQNFAVAMKETSSSNEIKLKSELCNLALENNKKIELLHSLTQPFTKARSPSLNNNTTYSASNIMNNQNNTERDPLIDPLVEKIEDIKSKLSVMERKIAFVVGMTESLVQKESELKSVILDYKKKNESLGYLNNLAERKFANIETVDFKAREKKKSTEYSLIQIKNELKDIKSLEKAFIQRKLERAKERKATTYQDEEGLSRTLLSLEEAKNKNKQLCEEIERIRFNEQNKIEHQINMRFLEENLIALQILDRFLQTDELNPSDETFENIEKNQFRKGELFKNHPEGLSEFASRVCEKFSSLSIQTESLNTIYQDLNNQKNMKKSVLESVNRELADLHLKNSPESLRFQADLDLSSNSGLLVSAVQESPNPLNPLTVNILQTDNLEKNPLASFANTIEKCQKVVFFLNFFLLTSAKKMLKTLFLILEIVVSIPNNLQKPLNAIINEKFKGFFAPAEFLNQNLNLNQQNSVALRKNTDSLSSPHLRKMDSDPKASTNEKSLFFNFEKDSVESFLIRAESQVPHSELISIFIELLGANDGINSIVIDAIKKSPMFGFLTRESLGSLAKKMKASLNSNFSAEEIREIARGIFDFDVFERKSKEISRLFEGISEVIELICSLSRENRRKLQERDPFYKDFPINNHNNKQTKFQVNDYIKKSYKKMAMRLDSLTKDSSQDGLGKDIHRDSANGFDQFYNFVDQRHPTEEKMNTIMATGEKGNVSDFIEKAHEKTRKKDPRVFYTEFRKKKGEKLQNNGVRASFESFKRGEPQNEDDFLEREREKIKNVLFNKVNVNESLSEKSRMRKSQSCHQGLVASVNFSGGNFGVLRKFAKDYSVLSKIYQLEKKKQGTANSKMFFEELMIQKKRKNLNFKKELADSSSNFHYLEKNQLYETRKNASQQLRETIKKNQIEISSLNKDKIQKNNHFSQTFHRREEPRNKSNGFRPNIRARTSTSLHSTIHSQSQYVNATKKMIHQGGNIFMESNSNRYDVLFENSQESVLDVLRSSNSSWENFGRKHNNLTSILIQPIS